MRNVKIIKRKAKSLKKERDDGFIEYKWKLINIKRDRLIKLISQMNYRLNEGGGYCMYAIGFADDGSSLGISGIELKITLNHILSAVKELNADINKILIFKDDKSYCAKLFIRKECICKNFC